jgi:hypothetical protein
MATIVKSLLSNCKDITMDRFIDCLVNHNYSRLVISGEFSKEELKNNWNDIFYDYCDIMDSNQNKNIIKLRKDIAKNEATLMILDLVNKVLSHHYDFIGDDNYNRCKNILHEYGYEYDFPKDDKERINQLKNVHSISKGLALNLINDRSNYDKTVVAKQTSTVKESDFDKIFIAINKFMGSGLSIKPINTTVSEYCGMIKLMSGEKRKN